MFQYDLSDNQHNYEHRYCNEYEHEQYGQYLSGYIQCAYIGLEYKEIFCPSGYKQLEQRRQDLRYVIYDLRQQFKCKL